MNMLLIFFLVAISLFSIFKAPFLISKDLHFSCIQNYVFFPSETLDSFLKCQKASQPLFTPSLGQDYKNIYLYFFSKPLNFIFDFLIF